ncbi:MAG: dTDP-glucose 4,6-dehydratase [Candidatus Omnitrophota bacterium]
MKKILVTGGAGFIGSNFIRYMLGEYPDYRIVNLDKLTYAGSQENLKDARNNPRYKFIKGDICDVEVVNRAVAGCDIIVNFAAESHVDRSITNAAEFVRTNVMGTHVLLETARKQAVSLFCQISTDEVYGSRREGFFEETDLLNPSSPYSASKAGADHLVYSYYITYHLPVRIVRPSNNFGPYQFPEKIIPLFIVNILNGKKVPVYGDGQNVRDWLYVLDNCRAIDVILHKGRTGEIYNVGGKNEIRTIDLVRGILKVMNKTEDIIEFVQDRPGHDRRYALTSSKIERLGWRPQYNFEQALRGAIEWYCHNQDWRKDVKRESEEMQEKCA